MNSINQNCSELVSNLLHGTQLDTIRIYSLIVQLGFIRTDRTSESSALPSEVWVTVSGDFCVEMSPKTESGTTRDFFEKRSLMLARAYLLIGKEVTFANVSKSGLLEIHLMNNIIYAKPDDEENMEEVWTVTSESPDVNFHHQWYISLDDTGCLSVRTSP
jgi:hypothetical protein